MINFNYENEFNLETKMPLQAGFLRQFCQKGRKREKSIISFVMTNIYINLEYLKHDDLTDIISFDYTLGNEIHGDILFLWNVFRKTRRISKCLWRGNTKSNGSRCLHYCGYKDKGEAEEYWCALKRMKNWRCSTWNSKVIFVLSAAMFHGTLVKDVIIWSK
jgi:ssRNA-specific RNase YbeY (16S rRNA maturation enzyme)